MNKRSQKPIDTALHQLKEDAKKLKKSSNLSLMQAQTVVAKKNGFNSWHDLLKKIKNVFAPVDKDFYLYKDSNLTSNSIIDIPEHALFHIGKESKYCKEQWLSYNASRCHLHIFEEHSSINSLDIHIAKQNILENRPLLFISSDTESTKLLMNLAISQNRLSNQRNIYLFDTMNQLEEFIDYKKYKLSLNNYSSGELTSFLHSYRFHDDIHLEKMHFLNFLTLVSYITIYQKQYENTIISLNTIFENGNLNQFIKYLDIIPKDNYMYEHLKNGVDILINNLEVKNLFEKEFYIIIDKIKYTNIFSSNEDDIEIDFESLYYGDSNGHYPIFIILSSKNQLPYNMISLGSSNYSQLINFTILTYYQNFLIDRLSSPIEESNVYKLEKKRTSDDSIAFIMREPYLSNYNYGAIASHNRAIGSSFIFTFNNLPHNELESVRLRNVLANATNFFFGKFTQNINANYSIKEVFNNELSKHLLKKVYNSKNVQCDYKSTDIEQLKNNEYIVFHNSMLHKVIINN